MCSRKVQAVAAVVSLWIGVIPAGATWSIIVVDRETNEIGIASATCLTGFNLKKYLPIVLVDVGAGAAQSMVDTQALNRRRIRDDLLAGLPPVAILADLESHDSRHQSRQYGIVDTRGRAATFSGSENGAYAHGLTGQVGTLAYSIQGNVITGQPVLDQAEAALLNTPGGIPEKLMAAMEAAHDMGGDGRCSCAPADPTGCGSPPPGFEKAAHVGFLIVTRRGDVDGECSRQRGCANGTYYLALNVKNQTADDPDPVLQLRAQFDAWRADLVGVADAVESVVTVAPTRLLNDGTSTATMHIELRDWQGQPAVGIAGVTVSHDPAGSAESTTIGEITSLGGGVYEVALTAGTRSGVDHLAVRVSDAIGERFLIPGTRLVVQDQRADLNHDGVVDTADLLILLDHYMTGPGGDVNGDGHTNLSDLAILVASL